MIADKLLALGLRTMEPTEEKTIILWGDDDLLVTAVEHVLAGRRNWKVLRVLGNCTDESLSDEISYVNPDVLIVHEGVLADDAHRLIRFVQEYPQLKIIIINLTNNLIEIYNKQTIRIKEATDLLKLIEKDCDSDTQGGGNQIVS